MAPSETDAFDGRAHPRLLAGLVVVFFGVGDVVTTTIGLRVTGVVERNPVVQALVGQPEVGSMIAIKLAVLVGAYLLWRSIPSPFRIGIPIGLAVLGVTVTVWNTVVILLAT